MEDTKMKTCYYCGTQYPQDVERCPLCGQTETEPEAVDEVPVALREEPAPEEPKKSRAAKAEKPRKNPAKSSGVFSTILCVVLALAVIAGALFIMESLGIISILPKPADETTVALPESDSVVACTGISVTPDKINFTNGGQKQMLTITVKPAGCTEELTCEVSDPGVISVSAEGEVTSVGEGEADITVTCGEFAASVHVTSLFTAATPDPVETTPEPAETTEPPAPAETTEPAVTATEAKLSSTDFTFFKAGETTRLTVDGADGADVVWSSSDPTVASVEGGKVTAVAPGMATITASVGGKELKAIARCRFEAATAPQPAETTPEPSTDVRLSHEDVTLRSAGETFTITLRDGDARATDVAWSSSNPAVAEVSAGGTVTAVGSGMATVTGTYNGASYKCIVRCGF